MIARCPAEMIWINKKRAAYPIMYGPAALPSRFKDYAGYSLTLSTVYTKLSAR